MTATELIEANPFPGLRPFATREADRFFGRRQQIADVLASLDARSFVAVTGASGCGKSSLVLAGVLSELHRRRRAGGELEWRAAVMRPGNQPIANLATALVGVLGGDDEPLESRVGSLYGRLRVGGLGLVEAVRRAGLAPNVRVLVIADQFEEIFRYRRMVDADEASAFIKLLLNAAGDPQSPVRVIITLRSEFLGSCADFRDLPEAINRGQYLVPKLTRDQRKEAIVNPAELRGATVAPRLVQRILDDVSDDFDDLPVMQHALTRTWNEWARECQGTRPLDLVDYEAVGTCANALSKHAEQAWKDLEDLAPVTERVFRALTERGVEGADVRRPLEFKRLCAVVGESPDRVERVVNRFRKADTAFLMPPPEVPLAGNPVIDVSHESLIRQWGRLREWAGAEAESRAMVLRIVEAARLYEAGQGGKWRAPDLAKAIEWQQRARPTDAWVGLYTGGDGKAAWQSAKDFLDASSREVSRERRQRGLRWLTGAFLVVALIVILLGWKLLTEAKSRELVSRALAVMGEDPAIGAHLAVAALDHDRGNPQALHALRRALTSLETAYVERILDQGATVWEMRYTRDGSRLVTVSGNTIKVFDVRSPGEPRVITSDGSVAQAWLVADNKTLIMHVSDSHVQLQPLDSGNARRLACERDPGDFVYTASVTRDERFVAVGCYRGRVLVWELAAPDRPKHDYTHRVSDPITVTALAFSGDGQYLASGDARGAVHVWTLGPRAPGIAGEGTASTRAPVVHNDRSPIRALGFHPADSRFLVTAGDDARAVVWELDLVNHRLKPQAPGQKVRWSLRHERPVIAARFAPRLDSPRQLLTVSDKTVRIWADDGLDSRRGHDDFVREANASDDGELLVTAGADGTARLWSTRAGGSVAILRGHRGGVSKAIFAPATPGDEDTVRIATASDDGTVRIWRINPPHVLCALDRWMLSAAFSSGATGYPIAVAGEGHVRTLLETERRRSDRCRTNSWAVGGLSVSNLSWSRDGKWLAGTVSGLRLVDPPRAAVWRAETRTEATPQWLRGSSRVVFSTGTDELVTIGADQRIGLWDVKSLDVQAAQPLLWLESKTPRLLVAISPGGKWIATGGNDRQVLLWRRTDPGAPTRKLEGHLGDIMSVQFSPDGKWLLTSSRDRTARIWPVESPGEAMVLAGGHTAGLFSAAFDPKAERVATASADSTIRIWDVRTGHELAVLRWHAEAVNEVQFGPDSATILSASDDGTVRLGRCEACNLTVEELRDRVRAQAVLSRLGLEEVRREIDAVRRRWMPSVLTRDTRP